MLRNGEKLSRHAVENISFASIGEHVRYTAFVLKIARRFIEILQAIY